MPLAGNGEQLCQPDRVLVYEQNVSGLYFFAPPPHCLSFRLVYLQSDFRTKDIKDLLLGAVLLGGPGLDSRTKSDSDLYLS